MAWRRPRVGQKRKTPPVETKGQHGVLPMEQIDEIFEMDSVSAFETHCVDELFGRKVYQEKIIRTDAVSIFRHVVVKFGLFAWDFIAIYSWFNLDTTRRIFNFLVQHHYDSARIEFCMHKIIRSEWALRLLYIECEKAIPDDFYASDVIGNACCSTNILIPRMQFSRIPTTLAKQCIDSKGRTRHQYPLNVIKLLRLGIAAPVMLTKAMITDQVLELAVIEDLFQMFRALRERGTTFGPFLTQMIKRRNNEVDEIRDDLLRDFHSGSETNRLTRLSGFDGRNLIGYILDFLYI